MTALAGLPAPSSFQLRWGIRGRKPGPSLRFRVCSCNLGRSKRVGLARAEASGAAGGMRESWSSSNGSPSSKEEDPFSGWFGADSVEGSSNGIVGVGLAGIFLAAGVAFASLSVNSKRQARIKQQMEPLQIEQEVLLSSDYKNQNVDTAGLKSSMVLPDDRSYDNKKGSSQSMEVGELASVSRLDDDTSRVSSVGHDISSFQYGDLDINSRSSVAPTLSDSMNYSNESSAVDSSVGYNFSDYDSNRASDNNHFVVEVSEKTDTINQEENLVSAEVEISDSSSQILCEPFANNIPVDPESNASTGPQGSLEEVLVVADASNAYDNGTYRPQNESSTTLLFERNKIETSTSETIALSALDQKAENLVLKETISAALEVSSPDERGPFEELTQLEFISHSVNEPESNRHTDNLRSKSKFKFIPAPSIVSSASQVEMGKVLVPAVVDLVQGQALAALQVLKVIEGDVLPGDICTRREYARWLVSASSVLSRSPTSKVYPAMYIENVTDLAFDDITPEDPDFPSIQGLAEAGLISSKLSRSDENVLQGEGLDRILFSPEGPVSRQDLVSWKMALEKRQLPEVDKKVLYQRSGYIDIDKIHPDAWPAIAADLSSGENGIISLAFGYTRLFQPEKPVTKAQAAIALSTGDAAEAVGEELTRIEAESLAETAVAAHTALVAEVEKDLNASFEKELAIEREKIDAMEKLAEEAKRELEKLRRERDEENNSLIRGRAVVESEMEVLSKLRNEVEEQLQSLMGNKLEIAFERDRINKLRQEAESENQVILQLQYELEVERKALAMARTWAEDEAKRAREQAKALEEARERWERHGIKVMVDEELRETASDGVTFVNAGKSILVEETDDGAVNLLDKLKSKARYSVEELKCRADALVQNLRALALEVKGNSSAAIERLIHKIHAIVAALKHHTLEASRKVSEAQGNLVSKASKSVQDLKDQAYGLSYSVGDGARKVAVDCKEGMEKFTQKFKT